MKKRCGWCGENELYVSYHDEEWGVPVYDERLLFEFLCLEGQQAGLSWITVLKKRERYRQQFHNFDIAKVAKMPDRSIEARLKDAGLIRNKLKLYGIRKNARAVLALYEQETTLRDFVWQFVDVGVLKPRLEKPKSKKNAYEKWQDLPAQTVESEAMSRALKKAGFTFVGPTICYAFMQAAGLVNDHIVGCYRYKEVGK